MACRLVPIAPSSTRILFASIALKLSTLVFFINLPACAGLIIATLKIIAESRDPDAKQLDLPGILTFSSGLGLTIWALIDGNDLGWTSPDILLRLVAAAIQFSAFVRLESKTKLEPVCITCFAIEGE